jgi:Ni/Co efflux regulator RcnB
MKNNLRANIGGALLTLALILGISVAAGSTAQAQYRDDRIDQNQRRDRDRAESHDQNRDWNRGRHQNRNRNDARTNGNYGGYGNNGGYNNQNQVQMNQGFQAGLNTGASDAQRGQNFNPQRSHYYQNASSQAFRQGFMQGYNQGYQQYGGYGNGRNGRNTNGTGNILGSIFGRP